MALIKCPECNKEISDTTDVCIYCGYKINKTNRRYLDFVFDAKASQNMDGMKLFNKAQELKYVSLTYKNYEIHILFEIQGRNKIDYFKDICTYFDKIS